MLDAMSSPSDVPPTPPAPDAPPPAPPLGPPPAGPAAAGPPGAPTYAGPRQLRRSTSNRVAAGVCGGLGEYFGVDPVLIRVLFATAAFFGGVGVIAYLVAWLAIPERGTDHAPVDRLVAGGRRSLPMWVLIFIGALIAWGLLFSWWGPWHAVPWLFIPLLLAVIVLMVSLSQRPPQPWQPPPGTGALQPPGQPSQPFPAAWDERPWVAEARAAARERRRRSAPVRWATLGLLALTLLILGVVDAAHGIVIPAYFWAIFAVVIAGLIVGAVLRRPIWWMALLLIPTAFGQFLFSGTPASLHDGSGDHTWVVRSSADLEPYYRQAFGRMTFDMSQLAPLDAPRTVRITEAGGQIVLIVPRSMPVAIRAKVRVGDIRIDGTHDSDGVDLSSYYPASGSGVPLVIDARVNAGEVRVEHR